ncbi:tRNA (adenosine(37)-N6)-threonylcarbamoyltransferase complex ATPase subunit type 1 TsaE [Psittacicella gerlachiana]|uniref:tRNA threonylcarbamoyladenosine biosynthesis protein TsaE n=1 Tax=Psittacicella gerlachiana TaxID=2028574 RepID=A0A3A1YAH1_9GAMM|nr:tRNA (adenosine(37)-N6)-threonylcarbamoyltransferase complex ATPase subunit type 1 TsaE [Psittacicella gerlachiana]RIY33154.1 tRNA (adenosine(37)-N6)-threonylcarbamoyltransferase complex ATPase subunit type 1 TsaE [Psittacicella gerlachiana]
MSSYQLTFGSQDLTEEFAKELWGLLAKQAQNKSVLLYLLGNLGAGKSTFSRAFIRAAGYQGNIPSPTYSIQEDYQLDDLTLYHLDLYRLSDPYELEVLGFFDNQQAKTMFLIEWPQMLLEDFPPTLLLEWQHLEQDPTARGLNLNITDQSLANSSFKQNLEALVTKYQ